jgi:hypothetical protein
MVNLQVHWNTHSNCHEDVYWVLTTFCFSLFVFDLQDLELHRIREYLVGPMSPLSQQYQRWCESEGPNICSMFGRWITEFGCRDALTVPRCFLQGVKSSSWHKSTRWESCSTSIVDIFTQMSRVHVHSAKTNVTICLQFACASCVSLPGESSMTQTAVPGGGSAGIERHPQDTKRARSNLAALPRSQNNHEKLSCCRSG